MITTRQMSMVSMAINDVKTRAVCCQRCTVAVLGAITLLKVLWLRRIANATVPKVRCNTITALISSVLNKCLHA